MIRVAPLAAVAVLLVSAGVANAQYYTTYYAPTTAYYQPSSVYYAPAAPVTTVAYAPATTTDNCCCGTAQAATYTTNYAPATTTTYYAPATTTAYYAPATPTVVYYPVAPRYRSFFRWW